MKKCMLVLIGLVFGVVFIYATGDKETKESSEVLRTRGPNNEIPVSYEDVIINQKEIEKLKAMNLTAAVVMHMSSDWVNALVSGVESEFKKLNIKIISKTYANLDSNQQRVDIENVLILNPDIIISLVLDPVSGEETFRLALEKGVTLVFISNIPSNFTHPNDYASIVTDDLFGMGKNIAEMIGEDLNKKGKVALLYHDANFYVTNQRDRAVESVLKSKYPDIEIVAKKGIANQNDGEIIASSIITQYPDVNAIYAPWDTIAEGVVAAVRVSKKDIKVYTMDIGATNTLELAKKGIVGGVVSDLPYELGQTLARVGGLSKLGKETPVFITVPSTKVRSENLLEKWNDIFKQEAPEKIKKIYE